MASKDLMANMAEVQRNMRVLRAGDPAGVAMVGGMAGALLTAIAAFEIPVTVDTLSAVLIGATWQAMFASDGAADELDPSLQAALAWITAELMEGRL